MQNTKNNISKWQKMTKKLALKYTCLYPGGGMNRVYIYANIICDTPKKKKHDVIKS
jgi:hypothetical protein